MVGVMHHRICNKMTGYATDNLLRQSCAIMRIRKPNREKTGAEKYSTALQGFL